MPQTLYLKYRPQDFDGLIGQEIMRITLKNASKEGKLSHAYLFTGPRGTGKTSTARIVAKAINCASLKPDGNPCNECSICKSINEGRLVDIIEIDAASHTSVEDVRDLIDKARFMPNEARKKVYIIDEVHMLSKSAFNALLKTLEEPPEHVHFILATTESHKVPETIISRCQKFDFKRIEIKDIVYQLKMIAEKEGIEADVKALNLIAKMAEGGMRNAIGTFEKVILSGKISYENSVNTLDVTGIHIIESLYDDINEGRTETAIAKLNDAYEGGGSLTQFTKDFIEFLRLKFLESIKEEDREKSKKLLQIIEIFEHAGLELKTAIIPQLPLEIAIAKVGMALGMKDEKEDLRPVKEKEEEKKEPPKTKMKEPKPETDKVVTKEEKVKEAEEADKPEAMVFSLENLRNSWPKLCDMLSPRWKHAFKNSTPTDVQDNKVTLSVHSNTYLEMVKNNVARLEMEKAIQTLFGMQVVLKGVLEKVEPLAEANLASTATGSEPLLSAEDAASLLGGEVVEE